MLKDRLKELRLNAGLTQQELGDLVHVTKVSICGYERGERVPSLDTLLDLANVLRVDLNTLVGYDKYVVSEEDESYGINISKKEIDMLLELRRHNKLYTELVGSPKRMIESIDKKY